MTWKNGYREPKYYNSFEESHKDCQRIWNSYYGRLPDRALADKWTGKDRAVSWMRNFYAAYETL